MNNVIDTNPLDPSDTHPTWCAAEAHEAHGDLDQCHKSADSLLTIASGQYADDTGLLGVTIEQHISVEDGAWTASPALVSLLTATVDGRLGQTTELLPTEARALGLALIAASDAATGGGI